MIQANELRIGNLLQYFIGEEGCEWAPTKIDWQDIKWATNHTENFNEVHKPIPLTPEILEKCGFVKGSHSWYWHLDHNEEMETFKIAGDDKDNFCIVGFESVFFQYLHQLQNIFFALFNTELNVEWSVATEETSG